METYLSHSFTRSRLESVILLIEITGCGVSIAGDEVVL